MAWTFSIIKSSLKHPVSIAPLAMFRVLFGFMMLVSIIRFIANNWVHEMYIMPQYHFTYWGFEWVKVLSPIGMYILFSVIIIACILIMLGLFYRFAAIIFFLGFTYTELIDKAYYLNHYYFISIISFLMILLPANRYFSIDVFRKPKLKASAVPRWMPGVIMLQLGILYFFAGLAKVNYAWLFEAQPLTIWLKAKADVPIIGWLFSYKATAYFFSWAGCIYDLTVPFLLINKKTRPYAYAAVVVFHLLTWWLFPIGMFPFIMIVSTLIFFPAEFHQRIINAISKIFRLKKVDTTEKRIYQSKWLKPLSYLLIFHFTLQVALPLRYSLYPGNLFWNEEGFRFSWRVMLMEKMGYAIFYVKDPKTGNEIEEYAYEYLTPQQEKQMSFQPDMILQFAHFLRDKWEAKGISNPEVRVESYVTLNGKGSRLYTDTSVNLSPIIDGLEHKDWIIPYEVDAD